MLLWYFWLGNEPNLLKLTQWCYYAIFHSEMIWTYQILCYYGIFHSEWPELTKTCPMILPWCFSIRNNPISPNDVIMPIAFVLCRAELIRHIMLSFCKRLWDPSKNTISWHKNRSRQDLPPKINQSAQTSELCIE
jgi:hypothetical protein